MSLFKRQLERDGLIRDRNLTQILLVFVALKVTLNFTAITISQPKSKALVLVNRRIYAVASLNYFLTNSSQFQTKYKLGQYSTYPFDSRILY